MTVEELETENQESTERITGGTGENASDDLASKSPEELAAMIKTLRKENAGKRVANKEVTQKLAEYEEWKRSQMSEAEKLKADLEAERAANAKIWAEAFCEKYNVPEDKRKFVKGTKDECEEIAQAFASPSNDRERESTQTPPNLFPGTRGSAVGSTGKNGKDFDALLREQLSGRK